LDQLEKVLQYTCLVLFDMKHMDEDMHKKLTGCSNRPVIRNLKYIVDRGTPLVIRVPVITTLNDDERNIAGIARILKDTGVDAEIELMPYHKLGVNKYEMLYRPYGLEELETPSDDVLNRVQEIFTSYGFSCKVRKW